MTQICLSAGSFLHLLAKTSFTPLFPENKIAELSEIPHLAFGS